MKAYLFRADGSSEAITPENEESGFTLERIQGLVGGLVELVSVDPCGLCGSETSKILLINEEGRLEGLPKNYMASAVANRDIVGDALYCPRAWFK